MSLTVKDGAGTTTSLKTTLTGSDHMPHHIVQGVSGTVNVTASAASPVYVTGNVSINQPINVDVDISDKLTVVVSGTAAVTSSQANPVWITGSTNTVINSLTSSITGVVTVTASVDNPVSVYLKDINTGYTTGAGTGQSAVLVYLTGAAGNKVEIKDLTLDSGKVPVTSSYANPIYAVGLMNVTTSVNSPVLAEINNAAADAAFNAISSSFGGNEIKVMLSGSGNTVNMGGYEVVWVRTTGSSVTVDNQGFSQAINYVTAAVDTSNSEVKFKVKLTGSSAVTIDNQQADAAFIALSSSFAGNELKVKLTGSNTIKEGAYDILLVRGTGSSTTVSNEGFQQAINYITSAYNSGDNVGKFNVHLTGNSNVTVDNNGFQQSINSITASTWNDGPLYALKVKITGSSVTEVSNSSGSPLYVTASTVLEVKEKPAKSATIASFYYPAQFNWSVDSGTFVLAPEDDLRKGLIITNPSSENLFIAVGSGSNNGFTLTSTGSDATVFSFILYPSGTYTAEPVMAGAFHAGYFVSQSSFTQLPHAMSTKVIY